MSRRKLHRFKHNIEAYNVIEAGKPSYTEIKDNWDKHFGNDNPLVL